MIEFLNMIQLDWDKYFNISIYLGILFPFLYCLILLLIYKSEKGIDISTSDIVSSSIIGFILTILAWLVFFPLMLVYLMLLIKKIYGEKYDR